jgi:enamine deaminase RidA (YjgF/YER057c/UK114 family)
MKPLAMHNELALPPAPQPAGGYRPWVRSGGLLFISGQLPIAGGELRYRGRVGAELSEAEGSAAAELAALNVLAQISDALGGFDDLVALLRIEGHVSSAPGFFEQPRILDAASAVFRAALGDKAGHARSAFAPALLPLDAAIELVATAAVRDTDGRLGTAGSPRTAGPARIRGGVRAQ